LRVLRKPNRFLVGLSVKKPILQPLSSVIEEVAVGFSSSTATYARDAPFGNSLFWSKSHMNPHHCPAQKIYF